MSVLEYSCFVRLHQHSLTIFFIFVFQIIMSFIQDNFLEQKPPELDGMKFYWLTSALWFAFLRYLNMCCCRGCSKHHLILYRHLEPCISVAPWGQFLFRISAVGGIFESWCGVQLRYSSLFQLAFMSCSGWLSGMKLGQINILFNLL